MSMSLLMLIIFIAAMAQYLYFIPSSRQSYTLLYSQLLLSFATTS